MVGFVSAHRSTEANTDLLGGFSSVSPTALADIAAPSGTATPVAGVAAAEEEVAKLLTKPSGSLT